MTLLDDLPPGTCVGMDTAPFIYYLEAHSSYGPMLQPLFDQRLSQGTNTAVTSLVSLAEVLVRPLSLGRADLAQQYRDLFLKAPHLTLVAVGASVAERAAEIRARFAIRLADAFQVAACLGHGASYLVTNDRQLRRITVLKVLILDDYLPQATP